MEQNVYQKAKELIEKSKKILLVTRTHPTDDSVGSLIALGLALEKMGKEIDLVCQGPLMSTLEFLPKHEHIAPSLKGGAHFVISLDTTHSKVSQFTYDFDNDGNKLNIYITPEDGMFDPDHVTAVPGGAQYDLVLIVDSKDLETLGKVYEENAKIFFETPIINIDSSLENEQYGEVNIIDVKANATTELVYVLIQALGEYHFDENIATSLLAGIISKTKSFQSRKTNPKAFSTAAKLIQLGADQQKIIQNLFKNKSLSTLKLWGKVLLGATFDKAHNIVSAHALKRDFEETSTTPEQLAGLEDELLASVGNVAAIVLFIEKNDGVDVFVKFENQSLSNIFVEKTGGVEKNGGIIIEKKNAHIAEVEQSMLGLLRSVVST
jgi:phosphoesterase RecJ-like protein